MPLMTEVGAGFGGAFGRGALRIQGVTVDYYSAAKGSFGLQIGAQQYAHALFFTTPEALENFRRSSVLRRVNEGAMLQAACAFEMWRKADDNTITADVWVYDPPALAEPWYVKQSYAKLANADKSLRIRYWNCAENQNNAVHQTQTGTTQFNEFTFDPNASKK
jgi:hypothetical protein